MLHCYRWTIWTRVPLCALSGCHLRTVVRVAAITVLLGAGVLLRPAHAQVSVLDFPVRIPTGPNNLSLGSPVLPVPLGLNDTLVLSDIHIDVPGFFGETLLDSSIATNTSEVGNGDPILANSFFDVFFDVTITDVDPNKDFRPPLDQGPITLGGLPSRLSTSGTFPANTSAPNFGIIPQYDGFNWARNSVVTLPDGSVLSIPDTTLHSSFLGQQMEPGNIFVDRFGTSEGSTWSVTTNNTSDSDKLVLPFGVVLGGNTFLRELQLIPPVVPTLPQWDLVLLTLALMTVATWHLAGRRHRRVPQ